ncbi:carbohydrate ABC transporter permease [Kribbella soli]|uniref:Carbohydrate ABC transporter permease n=1 Tax=Kribbella soli TaxID=1124743 RepID=A0A4R0HN04_9ACTN|nr:carbohydrate ABC transporter permease [Kribbella soli]TCC11354.1 carbohydrate ABC transporter permease [Kribbella soli]
MRTGRVVTYVVLIGAALLVIFPVYYVIAGSVMSPGQISSYPPDLFPHGFFTGNYKGATSSGTPIGQQYLNSVLQTSIITLSQLITSVLAAYAFVFMKMWGRTLLFGLFLATLMVPWESIVLPNYLTITSWELGGHGLTKTYAGTMIALVLPFLANAFGVFLLRQSFLQFPVELRDAATIDGAGHWRFLSRILLPLNKPALMAVGLYVFLSAWNQFFWPLLIGDSASRRTLQIGISQLNDAEAADPGLILAGVTLSILPTLAIVIFGQRFIVRGLTAGAIR